MPRLGQLLVRADLVSENNLARALGVQHFAGGRIGTLLLERGSVNEDDLGKTLAQQHGCEYVPWKLLADVPPIVIAALPAKFAIKHAAVPYDRSESSIKLALRDPADLRILDELFFVTGRKIIAAVAPEVRIYQALEKYYGERRTPRYAILAEKLSRPARGSRAGSGAPPPPPQFFPEPERPSRPLPEPHEIWGDADADLGAPAIIQSWKVTAPRGGWAGTSSPRAPRPTGEVESIPWEEMPPSPALWSPDVPAVEAPPAPVKKADVATGPVPGLPPPPPPPQPPSAEPARPLAVSPAAAPSVSPAPPVPAEPVPPLEPAPPVEPPRPAVQQLEPAPPLAAAVPLPPAAVPWPPEPPPAEMGSPPPDLWRPEPPAPPMETVASAVGSLPAGAPTPAPLEPPSAPSFVRPLPAAAERPALPTAADFPEVASATDRDSIGAAVLSALARRFSRVALFAARPDAVAGWAAAGDFDSEVVRRIAIPWSDPSVFLNVRLSRSFYLGPLLQLPRHRDIAAALGGWWPEECVVQPVLMKEKPVAFLFAIGDGDGVTPMDLVYLRTLAETASVAFASAIRLKKKEI